MDKLAYAVGRIRALEVHLLDNSQISRLADSTDFAAAYQLLREIPRYAEQIDRLAQAFDYETLLLNELQATRELLNSLAPSDPVLNIFWAKYDHDWSLAEYVVRLRAVAHDHPLPLFRKYVAAFTALNRLKKEPAGRSLEPAAVIAGYRYTDLYQPVKTGLENYPATGSLFALEREIDNYLLTTVQPAKYQAFGREPLFGFAVARENEIKLLRLILTAKQLRVDAGALKSRLRLTYV